MNEKAGRSTTITLLAPLTGIIVPLDEVPDEVFAKRMVGDGISIDPLTQELLAPCHARVLQVHRAGHAVTLGADGLEIIIHIGLDTVNLKGKGFTPRVSAGADVRAGDPLISFDADFVAQHARSLLTQIVITNMDAVTALRPGAGKVTAGRDVLLQVETRGAAAAAPAAETQDFVQSQPVVIASETGLHARPAALIASTAKRFTADVRLVKGSREANARSVVSIMALEVGGGDQVRVLARGNDAQAALDAICNALRHDITHVAEPSVSAPQPSAPAARDDGKLRGVAASPGVAVGHVFQLRHEEAVIPERAADPHQERRTLEAAISAAHVQLEALQARMTEEADADRAGIFAAHQELLEDPEVLDAAAEHIRNGASAAYAWRSAYSAQAERLVALGNPLLSARATDLRDVGKRVLHLLIGRDSAPQEVAPDSIIIAEDLTPSEAASLDRSRVRGFCTTMGSATSHVAILARALGIPAVAAMDPLALEIANGTRVVVDGDAGTLDPAPTAADEAAIARRQEAATRRRDAEQAEAKQPAVTRDGHRVEIVANIGEIGEAQTVVEAGGEGVGLLRTEFLFMDRQTAPSEDEQADVYQGIARALGRDRILVIRTLDVGGDKPLPYLSTPPEANPFLGERGIRFQLTRPDLLRAQVRAIMRAAKSGRVAMMFPMVSTLAEWRAARQIVEAERTALGAAPLQVGIMVETASAALLAERFAQEADFFSIGTNDLTQYTLAMDRTSPRLAPHVDALHPAVLQLIARTVAGARVHKRWVGVCGAVASDLDAIPILLGLGVDELSVSIPAVAAVKARVRSLSLEACRETARAALAAGDPAEVRALVAQHHGDTK